LELSKLDLLEGLKKIDADPDATARVLDMETRFRTRMQAHVDALPLQTAPFRKFATSPFVLMIYCLRRGYTKISEIEQDILPAKLFSSMETSAGRMTEEVMLPLYDWKVVPSGMQTANSVLDGLHAGDRVLHLATLKSGPRCLNDSISENIADSIVTHAPAWASEHGVQSIDFSFGALYGTPRQSNKKDWHILRNIVNKLDPDSVTVKPDGRWHCAFRLGDVEVTVTIRIGLDWWRYLGGKSCLLEMCVALVRACVAPGTADPESQEYMIADLFDIVSLEGIPDGFNASILQHSQWPWLFFLSRHFCDELTLGAPQA
jgi:hypothetical protein